MVTKAIGKMTVFGKSWVYYKYRVWYVPYKITVGTLWINKCMLLAPVHRPLQTLYLIRSLIVHLPAHGIGSLISSPRTRQHFLHSLFQDVPWLLKLVAKKMGQKDHKSPFHWDLLGFSLSGRLRL